VKEAQRLTTVGCNFDSITFAGKFFLQEPSERLFVIDDEYIDHNEISFAAKMPGTPKKSLNFYY
jgi:hypothetical protein